MPNIKEQSINYLNKSFGDFRLSLMNFAKSYFPNTYNDFSEADPGTMFLEMSAYVGDVLGFYLDTQIQENLMLEAKERTNIIPLSYVLGYSPKMSYASVVDVDLYQIIGASTTIDVVANIVSVPSWSYAVDIPEFTKITTVPGIDYYIIEEAKFTQDGNPEVLFRDPTSYFLKKTVKAISATAKTAYISFGDVEKFAEANIVDNNILQISSVKDSSGNLWYEVPYLANDKIVVRTATSASTYISSSIKYLMNYQSVPQRFVSRFVDETTLKLQFGAGTTATADSSLLPTPDSLNLGNSLVPVTYFQGVYAQPKQLFARQYGLAPANTVLTASYLVGGGLSSNIDSNQIISIDTSNISFNVNDIYKTVIATNVSASAGGRGEDTLDEIRLNALAAYQAQNRAVTTEDYQLRALSMSPDFGKVSKAYCIKGNTNLSLDLYVLTYDSSGHLTQANSTLNSNLATYLESYRLATDAINIKNTYIVNIGCNFDITTNPGQSNAKVLADAISILQTYFDSNSWSINQPIILSDIYALLLQTRGVQSVAKVEIINLSGGNYSPIAYDIAAATQKQIVYPSVDMMIFELKYKDIDIKGRVTVP